MEGTVQREKRMPLDRREKNPWRLNRWEETQDEGGKEGGPRSSMVTAKGGNVCDGGGGSSRQSKEETTAPKSPT